MTQVLKLVLLPVVLALLLPGAGGAGNGSQDKRERAKPILITIIVKVSGGDTALAEAEVEVTNDHEYDSTRSTNADGLARFTGVPRVNIEIVVRKKGWKHFPSHCSRTDLEAAGAEITVPVTLTKQ